VIGVPSPSVGLGAAIGPDGDRAATTAVHECQMSLMVMVDRRRENTDSN